MLGPLTGPPYKRKQYTRLSFTNATAYSHDDRVHYRFRGASWQERDRLAEEFAEANGGRTRKLPGKPGLVAIFDGDFSAETAQPTDPEE